MGRRKQKQMLFVQGDSLAEEVDSDDEQSGGLHIGNVVVLRAPMSSRSRMSADLPHRGSRSSQAAVGGATGTAAGRAAHSNVQHEMPEQVLVTDSDASLDDELKDYLDNVKQMDADGSDVEDATDEQQQPATADDRPPVAAGGTSLGSSWEDWDDYSSSRPGLGFNSSAAAARFADVSLDRALEGMLAEDFTQTGLDDSDTSSNDSSDHDSDSSSSSSSSDDSEAGAAGLVTPFDIESLDNTTAVVVDAQGQPMAVWEQLPLQHRFPVQTRQQQQCGDLQDARRTGSSSSSKKGKHRKDSKDRHTPSRRNSGFNQGSASPAAAAAGLTPRGMPCFTCDATTAAVNAAYAAAAAAADMDSVQRQQQRKQQKSLAKGANRGQLLPGEKKKLRKEKIAAKRAVRRGEKGQGALALLAAVEEFALSGGDMTMLPPCGKHKQAFTRSVAALYGVKASAQGGSSSGKTSLVLMSTASTALLGADSALQLQRLLVAELTQEMVAAAIAEGSDARGRQGRASGQMGGRPDNKRSPGQGLQRQRSRGGAAALDASVFQQPVAFVSAGVLDPNSSSTYQAQQQQQQQQPDSIEAQAEQACSEQGSAAAAAVPVHMCAAPADLAAVTTAAGAAAASFVQSLLLEDEIIQQETHQEDSKQPDQQQQQQQVTVLLQQQPAEPAWVIDKEPWAVQQHTGLGFGRSSTAAEPAAAAAGGGAADVTAGGVGCTVIAAEGYAAPLYDRSAMHLGLGFGISTAGLGVVQQQKEVAGKSTDMDMDNRTAAAAAAAEQPCGTLDSPGTDSSEGKQRLQELEVKFAALQAAANPAAAKWQQRRQSQQRQRQQRVEARLSAPNTALGPAVADAATAAAAAVGRRVVGSDEEDGNEAAGVIMLGLTKQQVNKAKKQQQRNARREAGAAAAAEGDAEAMAATAAGVAGIVSGSFAGFEAHTRGIGSRLMAGWGWREGEGLGRARQGRPEPLQATRRARNQGLGAE